MTVCPGREERAGPVCPAAIIGPPGEAGPDEAGPDEARPGEPATAPRIPSRLNALTVSTRDRTATAAPARWSFRIYRPFLSGEPRPYAAPGRHRK